METKPQARRSSGIVGSVFSGFFLTVSTTLLTLLLFLHALNQLVQLPAIGFISDEWLVPLLDEWYAIAIGGVLVALCLVFLVLCNTHRIRRFFYTIGCAWAVSAILIGALGCSSTLWVGWLPDLWQNILIPVTSALQAFSYICAGALLLLSFFGFSVYACIRAVKGGNYEQKA